MPLFKSCPSPSNFESQEANKKVRTWNTQKTKDPSQGSRSRPPWLVFSAESWLLQLQAACACMCHDKIMDEKRVGDGHQSIHRGLYIYVHWKDSHYGMEDHTWYDYFFTMACYFWNCLLFHVYLEDMYVCPGNFAARLWKGERNPLTANFWDAAFISKYQNQSKHKIHKIVHYT